MEQPIKTYSPLGGKTFALLVMKRATAVIILAPFLIAIFALKTFIPDQFIDFANWVIMAGILIIIIFIGFAILAARLEYGHYAIIIDKDDFKVRRGVISEEEIGIPYRRIKEVVIKRGLSEEIWGVSKIVITILGEEEGQSFSKESVTTLPFIDKKIASEIQDQIIERAGREQ